MRPFAANGGPPSPTSSGQHGPGPGRHGLEQVGAPPGGVLAELVPGPGCQVVGECLDLGGSPWIRLRPSTNCGCCANLVQPVFLNPEVSQALEAAQAG